MKICFFEASPHWSGGAKRVYLVAKKLYFSGYNPVVCCFPESLLGEKFKAIGGIVEFIKPKFDPDIFALFRILEVIKKYKIDILDLCSPKFYWIGSFSAKLTGKKSILTRNVPFRKKGLKKMINKILYNGLVDGIITVSEQIKNDLVCDFGISEERIKSIVFGIDPEEYKIKTEEKGILRNFNIRGSPLIAVISRLDERKGLEELIEAVPLVIKEFPDAKFVILGKGHKLSELKEKSKSLGVEKNIYFAGFVENIGEILPSFDITVMPSPYEALPRSVTESMACGVPVVSVDTGGVRQIIEDNVDGIICERCSPESIFSGIQRMLKSDYKKFGEKAREKILKNYSIDNAVKEYIDFCKKVLGK